MRIKSTVFIYAAAAFVLSTTILQSCRKVDFLTSSRPIVFKAGASTTKSAPVTTATLSSFQAMAVIDESYHDVDNVYPAGEYFNETVTKSGSEWTMAHDHNWVNEVYFHFWCYSPLAGDLDSPEEGVLQFSSPAISVDYLNFTYSLPLHSDGHDADTQRDIVLSGNRESRSFNGDRITGYKSTNSTYKRNDNEVDIVFHHPLSEICFAVSPTDGSFDVGGLGISSVALKNISGNGSCRFTLPSTFQWSGLGSADKTYSQNYNATFGTKPSGWISDSFKDGEGVSQTLYVCENAFFVIPQSLSGAFLSVTFMRTADGSTITKDVAIDDTWLLGKYYRYKISAKTLGQDIEFSATVLDWDEIVHEVN